MMGIWIELNAEQSWKKTRLRGCKSFETAADIHLPAAYPDPNGNSLGRLDALHFTIIRYINVGKFQ